MTTQTDVNDLLRRLAAEMDQYRKMWTKRRELRLAPTNAVLEEAHAYLDSLEQEPQAGYVVPEPSPTCDARIDSLEARMTAHEQGMCETPKPHVERIEKVLRRVILEGLHKHEGETIYAIADSLLHDLAPPSTQEDANA